MRMFVPTSTVKRRITIGLVSMVSTLGCALNRPDVKSLRDPTAARIQFDAPIDTTISALNAIPPKCGPTGNRRVRDEERRVYRIEGTITRVKRQRDHDIHVVLADTTNARDHLVVESDDPDVGKNTASPYRDRLAAGRHMLDTLAGESFELEDLRGAVVRVTGVGFFDFNHLQVGRSRSCIELHPILTIERVASPDPMAKAGFDSPPQPAHAWRSMPHGLSARAGLIGLSALRHVGLGPHVATRPDPVDPAEVAQLWTEPADMEDRDLFAGPWGLEAAPKPDDVYSFVAEKKGGFSPGYDVKSPDGTAWSVKMGPEAQTEVVASRLLWAVGFHQPPVYYLPQWTLVRGSARSV